MENGRSGAPTMKGQSIMKHSLSALLSLAVLAAGLTLNAHAEARPGEVDFGKIGEPDSGGKYVEINLGRSLLSLAARLVERQQPEAGKLLRSVELVRVTVLGLNDGNRKATEKRVREVRRQLDKDGWERIVTAQEKNGEDVCIFIKSRGEEALQGLVVTVLDGKKQEAVLINIVGDIRPEQVAAVGEALHIEELKKAGQTAKQ
jgi:hypothetical protein